MQHIQIHVHIIVLQYSNVTTECIYLVYLHMDKNIELEMEATKSKKYKVQLPHVMLFIIHLYSYYRHLGLCILLPTVLFISDRNLVALA